MRPTLVFPPELEIPPATADRSILLIGRHPHCDVVLKVQSVSRRHCVLVETDNDLFVRDLGSRHGIWVNGVRVEESRLAVGDEIAIGPVIVRVVDADQVHIGADTDDSGDSEESSDSPTELQGAGTRRSNESGPDSGFLTTEPIRPAIQVPAPSGMTSDVRTPFSAADPHPDSDDDIPSDSKLEEVL